MPAKSFELTRLDTNSFEHMVNSLAMCVLGLGHTGFGPGVDGGRDGYFEGTADYPSKADRWSGRWYIQSKFHADHLTSDSQKWLVDQVKAEIKAFTSPQSLRHWPDNWIIATNVNLSANAETGTFDQIRKLVEEANPTIAAKMSVWGGQKILDYLNLFPAIGEMYGEFTTPGSVLAALKSALSDESASVEKIIQSFVKGPFLEQQHTRLEQAGSSADHRPGIHKLFRDIPYACNESEQTGYVTNAILKACAEVHLQNASLPQSDGLQAWRRMPERARVWFLKGGPGQGKSTTTQFIAQLNRALLLAKIEMGPVAPQLLDLANNFLSSSKDLDLEISVPRIPIHVELKEFAQWLSDQNEKNETTRVVTFVAGQCEKSLGESVLVGTLKRALAGGRWLIVFDGLDEVPSEIKDSVAKEIIYFVNVELYSCKCDSVVICTSRPQGYANQFSGLGACEVDLVDLSKEDALNCAIPLLQIDRSQKEVEEKIEILRDALSSDAISGIMRSPLQCHIMAIVVRDGGQPPKKKWALFSHFYKVILNREANRNLGNKKLAKLLRESSKLIKTLHNKLGFDLHVLAEKAKTATPSINREQLLLTIREVVSKLQDQEVEETVQILMEATTERLVLVNTPEDGKLVRFDLRSLQEFFAAEYIIETASQKFFSQRFELICGDAHWVEVTHFVISEIVENNRNKEFSEVIVALQNLDHAENANLSRVNSYLARGSRHVARLLKEGILEEDKRQRESVKGCLTSLFGDCNAQELLYPINHLQTKAWLIQTLLSALEERTESECFGAVLALNLLTIDSPSTISLVLTKVQNFSSTFRVELLNASRDYRLNASRDYRRGSAQANDIITQIAIEAMASPNWHTPQRRQLTEAAVRYLLHYSETFLEKVFEMSGYQSAAPFLASMFRFPGIPSSKARQKRIIYDVEIFSINDVSLASPSVHARDELQSAPHYFSVIWLAYNFLLQKDRTSFSALGEAINYDLSNLEILPPGLSWFLFSERARSMLQEITSWSEVTEEQISSVDFVASIYSSGSSVIDESENQTNSIEEWLEFTEELPWAILDALAERKEEVCTLFSQSDSAEALVEKIEAAVLSKRLSLLGSFCQLDKFADLPKPIHSFVENAVCEVAKRANFDSNIGTSHYRQPVSDYVFEHKSSAEYFVILVLLATHQVSHRAVDYGGEVLPFGSASQLKKIPLQSNELMKICINPLNSPEIAAAAAILFLRSSKNIEPDQLDNVGAALLDQRLDQYRNYARCLAFGLFELVRDQSRDAKFILGEFLGKAEVATYARNSLSEYFAAWRQHSHAPVSETIDQDIWK
jgi:hypothetical protein